MLYSSQESYRYQLKEFSSRETLVQRRSKKKDLHGEEGETMSQNGHDWAIEIYKRDIEIYKIACEHYRQDLREFWSRTGIYILSQAFLFAAFAALVGQSRVVDGKVLPTHLHDVIFEITLGAIGALVALVGFFVTRGSSKWVDRWRDQVIKLDKVVDTQYQCYVEVETISSEPSWWKRMFLQSPGILTEWVPLLFFGGWVVMTIVVILAAFVPQLGLG